MALKTHWRHASHKMKLFYLFLAMVCYIIAMYFGFLFIKRFEKLDAKSMRVSNTNLWTYPQILSSVQTSQRTPTKKLSPNKTKISLTFNKTSGGISSLSLTFPTIDFRHRYESWYGARPDITSRLGAEQGKNSKKYLIFRCDKRWACGGWGSRVIGMTQAYLIANLTGRNFKMELLDPRCNLKDHFLPHMVNWSLSRSFHDEPASWSNWLFNWDIKALEYMSDKEMYWGIHKLNLTKTLGKAKYVYFRTDMVYTEGLQNSTMYSKELSWMRSLTRSEIVSTTLKHLLKPSPQLAQAVKTYLSKIIQKPEDKLICAHIRMGRNPTIPNDSEIRTTSDHLPTVWQFLKEHSTTDSHKIFIMTDSTETLDAAKKQSFAERLVPDSPGRVAHIERGQQLPTEDRCDALHKVIFDQQVLMNCDVLLISHSSLSRVAAYMRDSDDGLYCNLRSGEIVPCKPTDIIQKYNILR